MRERGWVRAALILQAATLYAVRPPAVRPPASPPTAAPRPSRPPVANVASMGSHRLRRTYVVYLFRGCMVTLGIVVRKAGHPQHAGGSWGRAGP